MSFDYKKEYKEFYLPSQKPTIIEIPQMNYIAVEGQGNPNQENGDYKHSIELLYTIAYTIKMSSKKNYQIKGYFDYVVPPLESFWWLEGKKELNYHHKNNLFWISVIRLPDFVTTKDVEWAKKEATKRKKRDFSKVKFLTYDEGLCVQCMHIGSYDYEPTTIQHMKDYVIELGYDFDITKKRFHHEIYLSDPRRVKTEKMRTVIRYPISNEAFESKE